jgi:diguanylate cyclase (GGDEF)-like protein/PAS domain S-box-containing protein
VVAVIALAITEPGQVARALAPLLVFTIALVGRYLLSRGKILTSKYVLAFGVWLTITAAAVFTGGVHAPVIMGYPTIIIGAAWLIHTRAALALTALTVVATIGMGLAGSWGVLTTLWPSTTVIYSGDQIVIYILSAALASYLVRSYQDRVDELSKASAALRNYTVDLERSKVELQKAQSVAKVGSWVYDLIADEMKPSAETCRIFGLPEGTRGSHASYLERAHPDDRLALENAWNAALKGAAFDCEHRIMVGQATLWIRQNAEFEFAADGAAIGAVGVTHDITDRKQADSALRARDERFRMLFDGATDGIIILSTEGTIVAANKAFARMHGYAPHELQSMKLRDLDTPDTLRSLPQKLQRILAGEAITFEVDHYHKDGHVIPFEVVASLTTIHDEQLIQAFHRDISQRRLADEKINHLAFYDPLTNLPNRRLLLDRLAQATTASSRHKVKSALLFVDLDNFKAINDTLGHLQGDLLLTLVTQRLINCVRTGDTVARLGSDEFVVLLEDLSNTELDAATQAEAVAEKILTTLNQEYQLELGQHHSTVSIGITLFGGDDREHSQEPLKRAELAMYEAKAAGRNTLRFFDQQMQIDVTKRVALETDLRDATLNEQFVLYYQPQVIGIGRITGVEVLLRWQHPTRGLVSPSEFIMLAEETGLILSIGQWVLETACQQLALWATQPEFAHLTMAVNVSARQFHQSTFVEQVSAALDQTGANPKRLKLELTESMLVRNVEEVIAKMSILRIKGVKFSLDDFGTGYSSLSYLKRLPLDQLKIDQSFVRNILTDPNDAAIAKTVIALVNSLGLSVIAEGVEMEAQRDFLGSLGCHAYQGYLFSRPIPLDAFEAYLSTV